MFSWLRNRRRKRLLSAPFPAAWRAILESNVRHYGYLPPADQEKLRRRVQVFVGEKTWVDCGGLEINDEVRVTIAAEACLLLLGVDDNYYFDRVRSILVYPGPYAQPASQQAGQMLVTENAPLQGEAWTRGPIVLSWRHVLADSRDGSAGRNLVLHEFAHHLDDLDGGMDGIPPLGSTAAANDWHAVIDGEYQELRRATQRGQVTLLDQYGATSPAEFFAVSVECFFERPGALRQRHPELYAQLRKFFRQDPEAWFGADRQRHAQPAVTAAPSDHDHEAEVRESVEQMRLPPESADGQFAAGVLHAHHQRHERAVASYTAALKLTPNDAEIYRHRAASLLRLDLSDAALADCDTALEIDPQDLDTLRTRAAVFEHRGEFAAAIADWTAALDLDPRQQDAEPWYRRGRVWLQLGQYREALNDLTSAIHRDSTRGEFYRARSAAYSGLGQLREAKADEQQARAKGLRPAGA